MSKSLREMIEDANRRPVPYEGLAALGDLKSKVPPQQSPQRTQDKDDHTQLMVAKRRKTVRL